MAAKDADSQQVHATVTSLGNTGSDEEPTDGDGTGSVGARDDQEFAGANDENLDEGYIDDPDAVIVDDAAATGPGQSANDEIAESGQAAGTVPEAARPGMADDDMADDGMADDRMAGDGMTGDGMAEDGMAGDGMAEDGMTGDGMADDRMGGGSQVPGGGQQLHDQWAAIQSSFVDDPRASVAAAAELVSEAIRSMIETAQQREQGLRSEWDREGTDTEALRNALRGYRNLLDQMVVQ